MDGKWICCLATFWLQESGLGILEGHDGNICSELRCIELLNSVTASIYNCISFISVHLLYLFILFQLVRRLFTFIVKTVYCYTFKIIKKSYKYSTL